MSISHRDTNKETDSFDAQAKENELRAQSDQWDTSLIEDAIDGDIPVINLAACFANKPGSLQATADEVQTACQDVGFFMIQSHGVNQDVIHDMFEAAKQFHALPIEHKLAVQMDRDAWQIGGVGYMPLHNRKLPTRDKGNVNEAFIVKRSHKIGWDDNQWPQQLSSFRETVVRYASAMEALGKRMLPIYARALGVDDNYFEHAFSQPLYRLRMTHYPPINNDDFGIAPHVDTSFCTILAQDSSGLVIYSEKRQCWIRMPYIPNALVVNTGELLKMWTNHKFLSVKHFANNNTGDKSRYSIPFFLNAHADFKMTCIATCCSNDNPPHYPPISYNESQAVVQGE